MKHRHAAALALVGWYLMMPPLDSEWTSDKQPRLSEWSIYKWFESEDVCNFFRADGATGILQDAPPDFVQQFDSNFINIFKQAECIASDDPRLKEK